MTTLIKKRVNKMYPLKLKYYPKTALWGGNTLKLKWGKDCEFEKLAETWELTVREKENNLIENGPHAGKVLNDYLVQNSTAVSQTRPGVTFPLLIKLIDANDKLSVQVHPDDSYANEVENGMGKTEMWHIVEADEDAEIIYGLCDGVGNEAFRRAFADGKIFDSLRRIKVKAGETYFIPAKLVHAIGTGCLIAEIQQNSDLTYRVYDYDRRDAKGDRRELHVQKAMDVVAPFSEDEINCMRFSRVPSITAGICLASCPYFEVHRLDLPQKDLYVEKDSFHHLLVTNGEGEILANDKRYPLKRGDSYFLPAGMGSYSLLGNASVLLSRL